MLGYTCEWSPTLNYLLLIDDGEPECYDEALRDENSNKWELAMKDEMDSLLGNQTWELTELPVGKKVLHNKWYQSSWWCATKVVRFSWSLPNGDRESLNGPHTKILEKKERKEKSNKGILLMVLSNGVVRGSHGHRRAGFPWMCVWDWHMVPMDGVRETHEWCIDEVKSPLGKGEWIGLVHGP